MKKKECWKYSILLLFFFKVLNVSAHPIKMTVSKLTFNTETKEINYTINLFMDDFQPVLKRHYSFSKWDFENLTENEIQQITNFINKNIEITVNDENVVLHHIAIKIVEENVCQIQFKDKLSVRGEVKNISVLNLILLEDYATQSNIVHVLIDDLDRKTYNLEKGDAFIEIEL